MSFTINSSFSRVFLLATSLAITSPMTAYAQDSQPDTPALSNLELFLNSLDLQAEELDPSRDHILQSLFRVSRNHMSHPDMETLEADAITGAREFIDGLPQRIIDAQTKVDEAQAKLDELHTQHENMLEEGGYTNLELVKITDQILEQGWKIDRLETALEDTEKFEEYTTYDLIDAALDYAMAQLDAHSENLEPRNSHAEGEQGTSRGGLGIAIAADGISKYVLNDGVLITSPLDPADNTPAYRAGLQRGDLITHVDGDPLAGRTLRDAHRELTGDTNTRVTLLIQREGEEEPLEVTLTREEIKLQDVTYRITDGNIAYIDLRSYMDPTSNQKIEDAIKAIQEELGGPENVAGYVLSLRNNGGGLVTQAYEILNIYIDGEDFDRSYGAEVPEDIIQRNILISEEHGNSAPYLAEPGDLTSGRPIVVLQNGGSASASEITTCALQDFERATIMGIQSFGKGSMQTIAPSPFNRDRQRITIDRYQCGHSERIIQAVGITPDVWISFMEESAQSEASLDRSLSSAAIETGEREEPALMCNLVDPDFDFSTLDESFIDPRSGDVDRELACAVNYIRSHQEHIAAANMGVEIIPYDAALLPEK